MPNDNDRRKFNRYSRYGSYNMSGKVGGKEYELFDINNLKMANKEMEKMIANQQAFIDQQDEIIRQRDKSKNITEEQREQYRQYKQSIEEANKKLADNNKIISNWNRNIQSNIINNPNRNNTLDSLMNRSIQNQQVPRTIADLFRNKMQDNARKSVDEIYNNAVKSVVRSYKRKGADFSDPAVMNKVNKDIQDKVLANEEFNKITKKFGTKTELFNLAVSTFSNAVSTWVGVAKRGRDNQSDVYENTFENISVRNGTTRSQYYGAQTRLQSQLNSAGVFNNIASSEVQTMWNTLASNGVKLDISNAEQTAKVIETVVTQHIVPYLDTTSKSFTIINERLSGKFVKDIRGINEANRELVGNNYATQDLLQQIIDEVQPMSDKALEDLAQGSAEITSMVNAMIDAGWSEDAAKSYATQLFKTRRYSAQIMRNGSLTERMALYGAMNNGINVYDNTQGNDFMGLAADITQMIGSWTPGYTSTVNGTVTNVVGDATGENYERMYGGINALNKGKTGKSLTALTNEVGEKLEDYTNTVTNRWTNDQNQTNKKLQDITVENFMNELAVMKEWFGEWASIIETAIKGIGVILLTKIVGGVIGKGVGLLTGLGGGNLSQTAGLGAALGKAGVIAGAIGAVALGISALNSWIRNQTKEKGGAANSNASGFSTSYTNLVDENNNQIGDATSAGALEAFGQQYGRAEETSKWKAGLWDNGWTNFWGSAGNSFNWNGYNEDDPADYNSEKWARTWAERTGLYDDETMSWVAATFAEAMLDAGNGPDMFSTVFGGANITTEGLKAFFHKRFDDENYEHLGKDANGMHSYAARILSSVDLYPVGPHRQYSDLSWTADDMRRWGVYRQGLDEVPYDNFPALLHQGEAVLTASTAMELRNLLDEYRETSQQSIDFDNIIQTQTSALVGKMDEVIKTIEQSKVGAFNNTDSMHKAKELLTHSMKYMQSTKSF